jgi:hypothetical protein
MMGIRQDMFSTLRRACDSHASTPVGHLLLRLENLFQTHPHGYMISIGLMTTELLAEVKGFDKLTSPREHYSIVKVLRAMFLKVDKLYIERGRRLAGMPPKASVPTPITGAKRQRTLDAWIVRKNHENDDHNHTQTAGASPARRTQPEEHRDSVFPRDSRQWDK